MGLQKNVSSQKLAVYAHDTANDVPKTGDAANITAQISLDFGTAAATNDTNPTELDATDHPGIYVFDLTQAETNAENVLVSAVSATSDISLDPVQVFTSPPALTSLGVAALNTSVSTTIPGLVTTVGAAGAGLTEAGGTGDQLTAVTDRLPSSLVGGRIDANMGAISGDSTAADNLEKYLDGTEFMPVDAHQQNFSVSSGQLTTKKPDGTTDTAYSPKTVTTDAGAEPITGAS